MVEAKIGPKSADGGSPDDQGQPRFLVDSLPHRREEGAVSGFFPVEDIFPEHKIDEEKLNRQSCCPEELLKREIDELRRTIGELQSQMIRPEEAETALRESEERYRTAIENSNDGVAIDKDGFHLFVNKRYLELFGYDSLESAIGEPLIATVHPDDKDRVTEIHRKRQRGGEVPERYEFIGIRKDGKVLYVEVSGTRITYRGETVTLAYLRDVTERKRAEEALTESDVRYHSLFANMLDGFAYCRIILDSLGRPEDFIYLDVNSAFGRLTGLENVIGKRVTEVFPGLKEAHPELLEIYGRVALTGRAERFEVEFKPLQAWLSVSVYSTKKEYFAAVFDNITERKRAEEALRKSEKRFKELFDNAPVGYIQIDTQGRITQINGNAVNMLGYTSEETLGQPIWTFVAEKEREVCLQLVTNKLAGSMPPSRGLERTYLRRNGTALTVLIDDTFIRDKQGNVTGIRSTIQDITERKLMEEDRKNLDARLQRMEKMEALGTLAGGVAHDLNNMLSGLVGYPDLILMQLPEDSPVSGSILAMKRSGQKAAAIVQDLLTLARRGMVSMEMVNWNNVISGHMKAPEQEKIQQFHPDVCFDVVLEPDLFPVKGSPVHLSKVIMNLLSNAAEAIKGHGVVTISTRNQYLDRPVRGYDDVKEGDYVVVEVSDTGKGISLEDREKIFEPFYTKKVMGRSGTGLGLAVVWGTVKDHNGYIDVQSKEGKGTTLTLYFPMTREKLKSDFPTVSPLDYMGKTETILVVDDVIDQRELAVAMLSRLNYQATSVTSGEAAIDYVKTHHVDLVVLDMIMDPGIDGLETYRAILHLRPAQKAIIASGFSETERVRQVLDLGAGAFIKKPYVLEKIGLVVRQELDKSEVSPE
jgi:PAS domain S-box-containing protein